MGEENNFISINNLPDEIEKVSLPPDRNAAGGFGSRYVKQPAYD